MEHSKRAEELFSQGYNCAQAVFAAFGDVTGFDDDTALRLSSSFGGGMGRMREVCGACSSMFMLAGLLYGYSDSSPESKKKHYELVQELAKRFKAEHNTIICRELLAGLKTDSKPEPSVRDSEYYRVRPCVKFVRCAARLVDELIRQKEGE